MALVRRYARTKMELEAKAVSRRQTFAWWSLFVVGVYFSVRLVENLLILFRAIYE